jgi:MinD superfamily P-loop ATPase
MKEIVIISGKGGTGKTSLTAAFATLAAKRGKAVFADCDVDAADLHLVFAPEIRERHEFISGHVARVDPKKCLSSGDEESCSKCIELCRFGAIKHSYKTGCEVDEGSCEGCGVCVRFCPTSGIDFIDRRCGEWYVSDTRLGTLVHAALDTRAENSGKLVTTVRKEAKRVAEGQGADWIIVDGSPGTGCPVIASITGADAVVIVTEPTMSGQHDLERVASLARHFAIPFSVIVNKADINKTMADATESWCARNGVPFLGMIPYDRAVTKAQIEGKSVIEHQIKCGVDKTGNRDVSQLIAKAWDLLC